MPITPFYIEICYMNCISILGISGDHGQKPDVCSKFPQQEKGKPLVCTKEYRPICGTNGITYPNLCFFCAAKRSVTFPTFWHTVLQAISMHEHYEGFYYGLVDLSICLFVCFRDSDVPLDIKHEGECKDVCSKYPEPPKGQSPKCTLEWKPVCGSDGQTYGNLCAFCHARRQSGNTITISHKGPCKEKDECSDFPVPPKGKPAVCTYELAQVCGSDGVTYPNKCAFCDAKRKSGGKLTIKHEGPCEQQEEKGE
ncbi:ovomucoid-like [Lacerta agilis]|uniref:ovomucoid-like n=1 Tax=Lacerta agilis TaxID=80427 RepID=UPI00141A4ECB|nr:ovomucoid-like [Lacerta agilis]